MKYLGSIGCFEAQWYSTPQDRPFWIDYGEFDLYQFQKNLELKRKCEPRVFPLFSEYHMNSSDILKQFIMIECHIIVVEGLL